MKKKFYLLTIVLFALAFFNTSAVKAENWAHDQDYSAGPTNNSNNCYSNNNRNVGPANTGGKTNDSAPATTNAHLPINNGVLFLFVAGMVIGVVTLKKFKSLTPVMAS